MGRTTLRSSDVGRRRPRPQLLYGSVRILFVIAETNTRTPEIPDATRPGCKTEKNQ